MGRLVARCSVIWGRLGETVQLLTAEYSQSTDFALANVESDYIYIHYYQK